MGGISIKVKGDYSKTRQFLRGCQQPVDIEKLRAYGERGVEELKAKTPVKTGKTRDSWFYGIDMNRYGAHLYWYNTNYAGNPNKYVVPVAILINDGHATKNGHWVPGEHYIEAALNPVLDDLVNDIWKGMTK